MKDEKAGLSLMRRRNQSQIPRPQSLREVPGYLAKVVGGFFYRLFYIISLVWEVRPSILFFMMFFCVVSGLLPLLSAYINKELLNYLATLLESEEVRQVIGEGRADQFLENLQGVFRPVFLLLCMLFAHHFIQRVVTRVNSIVHSIAGELVVNHIKLKIMHKAKTVDISSFDRPEFYEKLENANREAGHRPLSILTAVFNIISTSISAVGFIVILIGLHPLAPVMIILCSLPAAIVNYVFRHRSFRYLRYRSKERRQMQYFSGQVTDKDKAKELRLLNLSDTFIDKYQSVFKRYYAGVRRLILQEGFWHLGVGLFSLLCNCSLFLYVAYTVVYGQGEIGDYSLYTGALTSISSAVTTLITTTATIYEGTLFIDNMITFMREPVTITPNVEKPLIPARHVPHTIVFEDVSFCYPGTERPVLQHINLCFRPGESVVLVGLNGAGKTTLIKLMLRLYDPTEGRILLDGEDLRSYDTRALYDLFGVIFQDFGKYAVSVRENITFGDISREEREEVVRMAAHQGNAEDFISRLPNGYDTPLMRYFEENGIELSIGQWQKLSVARAFYKDSDILILDEPTASLDAIAEQEIFNQFATLSAHKTTLFVSHRLSSATTADQIVVLQYGEVIENGTHAELMAAGGAYYNLFTTQASRYMSGEGERGEGRGEARGEARGRNRKAKEGGEEPEIEDIPAFAPPMDGEGDPPPFFA